MSISDTDNVKQYVGNGSTDTFSTGNIVFYESSDLIVTETVVSTGVDTVLVEGSGNDYTVSGGSGSSGSVTLTAGNLPSTKQITIQRQIPYTQSDNYVEGEQVLAETIETAFDKSVIRDQQLRDSVNKSLKFSPTLPTNLVGLISQAPVDGNLLAWDGVSGDIKNASTADIASSIDTVFSGLLDGDLIQYDSSSSVWVNIPSSDIQMTDEEVQDVVGLMVTGNTETNITVTYQDSDGTIDFVVPSASETVEGVVEAATTAEMSAGTANKYPDSSIVKTYVDGVVPSYYESANTVYANNNTYTFTHGLGSVPKFFDVVAVCTTANGIYAVGDELKVASVFNGAGNTAGAAVLANSTQVKIVVTTNGIMHNGTFLTASNFRLKAKAWV